VDWQMNDYRKSFIITELSLIIDAIVAKTSPQPQQEDKPMLLEWYRNSKWFKKQVELYPTITIPVKDCRNHKAACQIDIESEDGSIARFQVHIHMDGRPKATITAFLKDGRETEKTVTGILDDCKVSVTPIDKD